MGTQTKLSANLKLFPRGFIISYWTQGSALRTFSEDWFCCHKEVKHVLISLWWLNATQQFAPQSVTSLHGFSPDEVRTAVFVLCFCPQLLGVSFKMSREKTSKKAFAKTYWHQKKEKYVLHILQFFFQSQMINFVLINQFLTMFSLPYPLSLGAGLLKCTYKSPKISFTALKICNGHSTKCSKGSSIWGKSYAHLT